MRGKFEAWMLKLEFGQDTFQSFVCWMLFAGTVCSLLTPAYLITTQLANPLESCEDGTFTILAHFRLHSWLYTMFEDFKNSTKSQDHKDKCFELIISDSQFDESAKPSLWIPENLMWLDLAEADLDDDETLLTDTSTNCTHLVNIPMGLVTWQSLFDGLGLSGQAMDYNDFLHLADVGWKNYTNGALSSEEVLFSHAHPNVTSSGLLGMALGYQFQTNNTETGDVFVYSTGIINNYSGKVEIVEARIHELGPNELSILTNFLSHGPDYVDAMFGFENSVAYNNYLYHDLLHNLWDDDEFAFVYFTSSFWMTHPICVLNEASWMDGRLLTLSELFVDYITNSTSGRLEDLLDYGIRPMGASGATLAASEVLNASYGVNVNITDANTNALGFPDADSITSLRKVWQSLKEPVYLKILMDVSDGMQELISGTTDTIWTYATEGLEYFPTVLEDNAIFEMHCFSTGINDCGTTSWPNGTLNESRTDIIDFIDSSLVVTQDATRALWNNLNVTLTATRALKAINDAIDVHYNYVIIIISGDNDYSDGMTSEEILEVVGVNYDPHEIHIYPIWFWGNSDSTKHTLEEIATRTNGEFYETTKGMADILTEIGWYF